jgi:hypothetical protein
MLKRAEREQVPSDSCFKNSMISLIVAFQFSPPFIVITNRSLQYSIFTQQYGSPWILIILLFKGKGRAIYFSQMKFFSKFILGGGGVLMALVTINMYQLNTNALSHFLDQWLSTWGTHTPGYTRRHLGEYAKTSHGVRKIGKRIV